MLDKLKKFRKHQQGLCVKVRNLTSSYQFFYSALASNVACSNINRLLSTQNFNNLLQFHLQHIPSVSFNPLSNQTLQSASSTSAFVTPHVNTKEFCERLLSDTSLSVKDYLTPAHLCNSVSQAATGSSSSFRTALKPRLFNN